jgi:hypothetical protein
MKPVFLLFFNLLALTVTTLFSQSNAGVTNYSNAQQFMNDANGRPMYMHAEYAVEGSPFFSNDYCTANLKLRKGKTYNGIKVKLNLQENLVIYDAGDGKEMIATSPIEKIEFFNCNDATKSKVLVTGYPAIDKQDVSGFYILMDSGSVQLLKHISVNYRDTKYYGDPNMTRVFEQKETYYAYSADKGMMRLSKDNNLVLTVFNNRKQELAKFIAANDLKCKREEDLVKVFAYYNSLNK